MGGKEPVSDRYRPLSLLGEGGTGRVWLVEDSMRPGVRLALKESLLPPPAGEAALRREFVLLSRLRHPGIVEAYDFERSPVSDQARFTLQYVEGESVASAVAREGTALLLTLAAEALGTLAFLHDFGLIHRDVKPANLLVRRRSRLGSRLVFLDLGLAAVGDEMERAAGSPAAAVGTLPYLAPELLEGAHASRSSDLYGLGAVLYEVVHGELPHALSGATLNRFVEIARKPGDAEREVPAGYPPGLGAWLADLLATDPALRPAGAREALARLNAACRCSFATETAASRAASLASDPPAGRERECRELWSLLELQGGPRVAWLTGPAGIGKSRMLRWLRTEAILRGWSVFNPPVQIFSSSAYKDDAAQGPAVLIAELRQEAAKRPTLLVLDDVQAGGGRLALFLDRVAREAGAPPLRVVAGVRPAEVTHALLRRLLEDRRNIPTLHEVELRPLDESGIRALVQRATRSSALSEARLRWLVDASEGNPLLAEAMLVDDTWTRRARGQRSTTLERSVDVRLDLLSVPGRDWLEALVVLGADTPDRVVARLAELEHATARDAAEEARLAGLARVHRGRWSPEARWVVDQVLARITQERRGPLHQRAAELLLSLEDELRDPWRLARLWSAAGAGDKAAEYAEFAAREAERLGEPSEAADRWSYALRHLSRGNPGRYELRDRQAESLMAAGRYEAAVRAFGAVLRLAQRPAERADLLGRQAQALVQSGRFARAQAVAEQALQLSAALGFNRQRGVALKALGQVLGRLGRESDALPLFEEALAIFQQEGDLSSEAETLHCLAAAKNRLLRDDAEPDFLRAVELHRRLGQSGSELKSLVGLAMIHMRSGRIDQAQELLEDVRRKSVEHGNLDLLETALSKLASLAIEGGRLDRALALGQEALGQALHLSDRNRVMVNRCRLAEAMIGCGRPAQAVDLLREALSGPLEQIEPDMLDTARVLLAHALLEVPGSDDADIALLLGIAQQGFRKRGKVRTLLVALVTEMERRSRPGHAEPFAAVRSEYDDLCHSPATSPEPETRLRAELALTAHLMKTGELVEARDAATAAAELGRQNRMPAYTARCYSLLAQALEKLGEHEPAAQALRTGAGLLEEAARLIEDPAVRSSFFDRAVFRRLRQLDSQPPSGSDRRLVALYEMIRALNSETDPDGLLESILDMALAAVSAERGMILLSEPGSNDFCVRLARNLERETEQDVESISRTIAAQAGAGRSIVALDTGHDARFRDVKSVSLYGIRSLMCVPLRSRGRIIGTVYLDSRGKGSLFSQEDLRFVEAFADHAALALQNVQERAELLSENRRLQLVAEARVRFGNLVGKSPGMQQVFELIEKVAASDLPVLIEGESGTGKELVARAIHFHGARRRRTFISENCAAIPESLLESELFGHVRGAFTGAERDRRGLFEQADGGTLFLDEVGDMSAPMQARLLRVLQQGEIRRVGADRVISVNVRVLAATHRDLAKEVQAGRFREDLFYRLQVLLIHIPPLRDRPQDTSLLIDHFLERIARERGRPLPRVEPAALAMMQRYGWPGNVRQLENILQRLTLLAGDGPITLAALEGEEAFRSLFRGAAQEEMGTFSLEQGMREQLLRALEATQGNRERAARLLGVSRATIYRKIKELGI